MLLRVEYKSCSRCQVKLPTYEFAYNKVTPDGFQRTCRSCMSRAQSRWYQNNQEQVLEAQRAYEVLPQTRALIRARRKGSYARNPEQHRAAHYRWKIKHPDRALYHDRRKRAVRLGAVTVPFTNAQLEAKIAYWNGKCWLCGKNADTLDHVKPLARGGPHMLSNLRPSCRSCNSSKKAAWPIDTRIHRGESTHGRKHLA